MVFSIYQSSMCQTPPSAADVHFLRGIRYLLILLPILFILDRFIGLQSVKRQFDKLRYNTSYRTR